MNLKIGLFSLKPNVGCSAITRHVANFLATNNAVALIERVGKGESPEFHRVKTKLSDDGTFIVNNVHYYPELKMTNKNVYPPEYEKIEIPIEENVQIYDFGVINFMFQFPENMNKIYLVTDTEAENINKIQEFYHDISTRNQIKFDLIIVGASRETTNLFKESLPFIASVIPVTDKKEPRIDYMFAMKLQLMIRSFGIEPPKYNDSWEYAPIEFYSEDEWNTSLYEQYKKLEEENKKQQKKQKPPKKKSKNPEEEIQIDVQDSKIATTTEKRIQDANVFEYVEFEPVPEPTYVESENGIQNSEQNINDIKKSKQNSSNRSKKQNQKDLETKQDEEQDEIKTIAKVSESFEPEKIDEDVFGEYQEHIIYEYKIQEQGLMGEVIDAINRGGHFCCNLFFVTNDMQLFVFSKMDTFFEKLDTLKGELKNGHGIHYAMLTYNDENRKPRIITNDVGIQMSTYQQTLGLLDNELRTSREFSYENIKNHKELVAFKEVIYA